MNKFLATIAMLCIASTAWAGPVGINAAGFNRIGPGNTVGSNWGYAPRSQSGFKTATNGNTIQYYFGSTEHKNTLLGCTKQSVCSIMLDTSYNVSINQGNFIGVPKGTVTQGYYVDEQFWDGQSSADCCNPDD